MDGIQQGETMGILRGLAAPTAPKAARATDGPAALVAATRIPNPKSRASCVFRAAFRLLVSHKAVEVNFAFCVDAFDVRSQFIFQREDIHRMTR